jgi:integrase
MLFTGMRKGEAAALCWEHVDLTQKVIRVPAELTKAKRKLENHGFHGFRGSKAPLPPPWPPPEPAFPVL